MKLIEDVLRKKVSVFDFMVEYRNSDSITCFIQQVITNEALSDMNNELWRTVSYSCLSCYNFNIREMLFSLYGYGETEDYEYEIYTILKGIYHILVPNFSCRNAYSHRDLYLDLEQECFGGPEVIDLVKTVANEVSKSFSPKDRKKMGKKMIKELFHYTKKKPKWIQGPDWPMGAECPMEFIGQIDIEDGVRYIFVDTNTNEKKDIIQMY